MSHITISSFQVHYVSAVRLYILYSFVDNASGLMLDHALPLRVKYRLSKANLGSYKLTKPTHE